MTKVIVAILMALWMAGTAVAQQTAWVQVEAQPTLRAAQDSARRYAQDIDNVAGFFLGGRWYGVVIGPYAPADADRLLRQLRASRQIPADSYIVTGEAFRQQFWPIGVGAATTPQPLPGNDAPTPDAGDAPAVEEVIEVPQIIAPDETPRQARASEALLTRDEKRDLQTALEWAGFYAGAIDGLFGRGTRGSMGAWQEANNHEVTGVLTTSQRAELIGAYNAVLDGMDLQLVRDDAAGIEMLIPTGVVKFAEYQPPFARFDASGDLEAQVLLISQPGNQDRFFGLYEILQTLAIVPKEGERARNNSTFQIEGIDADVHTTISARLEDGTIKGFALVWPAGDDERRRRVLEEMSESFTTLDGVLDPALTPPSEEQAVDLVAGLAVRKPKVSRSGFFISGDGTVLTTAASLDQCDEVTINTEHAAELIHRDDALGIAVLRPLRALAPLGIAQLQTAVPRLQSEIAVAGYPYGGVLSAPALTFGRLADIRGLNGEDEVKRLSVTAQPGDVGGPVFDNGGAVLGMLLPKQALNGQVLPDDVSFAVDSDEIVASLLAADIDFETTDTVAFMDPAVLTNRAIDLTVLVSCW